MKRIALLLLCACLLLSACTAAPQPTDGTTQTTQVPSTSAPTKTTEATEAPEETQAPTTTPVEETSPDETQTEIMIYQHPLTGEALTEPFTTRPIAVVTNNIGAAQPLMGVGSADILFEHIAEGGGSITRMLAVYTNLENAGQLGSIRSARTYLLDLARNFDAPIAHCGTSIYAEDNIRATGYASYDQFKYPTYYYRDKARLDAGYSSEHTMMIDSADLVKGLKESGFDLTADADAYYGMDFAEEVDLSGADANKISFTFYSDSGKTTVMTYDASEGVYHGEQKWHKKDAKIIDGNTNKAVPFKNVLILCVKVKYAEDDYHVLTTMTGEGTGYFACNGKYVPIKWYRASTSDPFTYTLEDGTPLVFGIGKTYVAMLPTRSPEVKFS